MNNTSQIVHKYLNKGLAITYIRNDSNLGMDGNFVLNVLKRLQENIYGF